MIVTTPSGEHFVVFRIGDTIDDLCREALKIALENNDGKIVPASKALGICRRTALNWRKKYFDQEMDDEVDGVQ